MTEGHRDFVIVFTALLLAANFFYLFVCQRNGNGKTKPKR
jgi:hypothetical protein